MRFPPDRRGIDNRDCDVREAEEVRDREFREGAVRIVEETNKPIAQVARDLGVNEGTLGNWVNRAREAAEGTRGLSKDDVEELKRLRAEVAELRMERDVLKRSVVLWVKEATK
ncbi:transposase [Nocardioides aromaticivorans]|uniref:transposase n=1 Tax=Nocardioides aromaticivorans TaxID=200618 RepID=UPI001C542923|nr:transposase [Nocardioides aromaticivorans]